jgi:hypothetical protein
MGRQNADDIRMQSLEASKHYKNSIVCATRIIKDEGVFTLWSGAMPRLARLIMSGGIVFTMFVTDPSHTMKVANYGAGMRRLWMGWTCWIRRESICRTSIDSALIVYMVSLYMKKKKKRKEKKTQEEEE